MFKMAMLNGYGIKFNVRISISQFEYPPTTMKKISNGHIVNKVEACVTITKDYPAVPPMVNFTGNVKFDAIQEMDFFRLEPFRNYFPVLISQYSAKVTIMDIADMIPRYVASQQRLQKYVDIPFA